MKLVFYIRRLFSLKSQNKNDDQRILACAASLAFGAVRLETTQLPPLRWETTELPRDYMYTTADPDW